MLSWHLKKPAWHHTLLTTGYGRTITSLRWFPTLTCNGRRWLFPWVLYLSGKQSEINSFSTIKRGLVYQTTITKQTHFNTQNDHLDHVDFFFLLFKPWQKGYMKPNSWLLMSWGFLQSCNSWSPQSQGIYNVWKMLQMVCVKNHSCLH